MRKLFDSKALEREVEQSGYTKTDLAKMIGCHPSELTRYVRGEITPRPARLKKMVEIFGPSITGLSVSSNNMPQAQGFTQDELRIVALFETLPYPRQCYMSGFLRARVVYGPHVDAEFAANLSEQLANESQRIQEQSV